jgi:hypothetical protein
VDRLGEGVALLAREVRHMQAPDLATILDRIRAESYSPASWLALACWLADNGRDDEAAAVRGFWLELRECLGDGETVETALDVLPKIAPRLAPQVRTAEERQYGPSSDRHADDGRPDTR